MRYIGRDTVEVIPGPNFRASAAMREAWGENYRREWTTPIRVPVMDLGTFRGGLTPTKEGGGMQAPNLRLVAPDSSEWVFRLVRKTHTILGPEYNHTVIERILRDQGSASHPTGNLPVPTLLNAVDILHPTPRLYFMPDDPRLGEFRKDFGGVLGTIEEFPSVPQKGRAFAGAEEIIDSDKLLEDINKDADVQIDARAFLKARLVDFILGDNDRHPDNWKWAKLDKSSRLWVPIARDRDKVFVSYGGTMPSIARVAVPSLVRFYNEYPDPAALSANASEFDRRLLATLNKAQWDSVATTVMQEITDPVIEAAVAQMPPEYRGRSRSIAADLKARRNGLRGVADRYYSELWKVADIHGTDADDQATVTRVEDGSVQIDLHSANKWYFSRRFYPAETKEIRLYLHGGNDQATVVGAVSHSIPLRIIGGNGTNTLVDGSTVGGKHNPTRLYDVGTVNNVKYATDTVDVRKNLDMAFNHSFNRRPWLRAYGGTIPPQKDYGTSIAPYALIHSNRSLGVFPEVAATRYTYGFRKYPYSTATEGDLSYSVSSNRWRARTAFDKRFEESDLHVPIGAGVSQLEIVDFHGFGNDVADLQGDFYDVHVTQWAFRPAIGLALNERSDISLGPIVRYASTDSVANRFIAQQHPYGFSKFGQAGLQFRGRLDSKPMPDTMKPRFVVSAIGSVYPAMMDVVSTYESLDAWTAGYFTLPLPKKPVLALRAGGKKLWGDFPYFDAAFLGGSEAFRVEYKQRWAGDASLYGTTELRYPLGEFPLIVPVNFGTLGFVDAGRVYVNGDSPGGWHTATGAGFWFGFLNSRVNYSVMLTNQSHARILGNFGFAF
ncbi:MAG: hypothetical protein ACJ79J_05520 [Gemmatimonadaceae bacterium]